MKQPDSRWVSEIHPSPNVGPRDSGRTPSMLVLHYTGLESAAKSIEVLSRPDCKVSCHYVVDVDGTITQLVPEDMRAWHAGLSAWAGEADINSCSIGIEIQNPGHNYGYPEFTEPQMQAVERLALDIAKRHAIAPARVLAHSDVAPQRKIDPGEKFDWARLHKNGVGHWVQPTPVEVEDPGYVRGVMGPEIQAFQKQLHDYGYDIQTTGRHDAASAKVVAAFQRHFRPERVDGAIDQSTRMTLQQLAATLAITDDSVK